MTKPEICREYESAYHNAYMDTAKCEPCGNKFLIINAQGGWSGYTIKDIRNLIRGLNHIAARNA